MQDCEETRIMLLFNFSEYKNDLLVLKQWKGALNQHHTYFRCSSLTIRAQSLNFKRVSELRYCPFKSSNTKSNNLTFKSSLKDILTTCIRKAVHLKDVEENLQRYKTVTWENDIQIKERQCCFVIKELKLITSTSVLQCLLVGCSLLCRTELWDYNLTQRWPSLVHNRKNGQ